MLSRVLASMMQGTVRGCFFVLKSAFQESQSSSLVDELQAESLHYREESQKALQEAQSRLADLQAGGKSRALQMMGRIMSAHDLPVTRLEYY